MKLPPFANEEDADAETAAALDEAAAADAAECRPFNIGDRQTPCKINKVAGR
jgi:hypothetical protein